MNGALVDIITFFRDSERKSKYRNNPNPYAGHCYVACEVLYHLGLKNRGFKPCHVKHEGDIHWFLRKGMDICDPTAKQFQSPVKYEEGVCCGFLTTQPSKRARVVIERIEANGHRSDYMDTS